MRSPRVRALLVSTLLLTSTAGATLAGLWLSGEFGSRAVQVPEVRLDMNPAGNTYDDATNTMTVGTTETCMSTNPGDNTTHFHIVHLVIRNVEDLAGWQVRLNFDGNKMKASQVIFEPFTDQKLSQNIGFLNLPIDQGTGSHRTSEGVGPGSSQTTSLIGATFAGRTIGNSPDTPAKSSPDDFSYSAPSGGVLAAIRLQVLAGNSGQMLSMDLDDANPNRPGSKVLIFTGTGQQTINLSESSLGDGLHAEGMLCPGETPTPAPTASPTPTVTPTPNPLDTDGDGVLNAVDNCPMWYNPSQNLPPWNVPQNDPDCDSFSTTVEDSVGTDPNRHCGADAWPPDINNDSYVDVIGDISRVTAEFSHSVPPAPARYDMAPDPPDHYIDVIRDITRMTGLYALSCN